MTAKHRGKKNKHNHEDFNNFNHESSEPEARGGNQYTLLFILFLLIVVGGATAAWFCFQQHQSITYLADNLMGMQMRKDRGVYVVPIDLDRHRIIISVQLWRL